ncbi:MAG: phosphoribosylformylglycinamidine synthase subunit PurQ, partial [Candidatus Dadabacteria bacterium]
VFPGTNCERETLRAFASVCGVEALPVWHKERLPEALDLVVVPGGFSYGDYLRPGAIARFGTVMQDVIAFAHQGGYVLGICNGFQVLTEAGLLPGALIRNRNLRFVSTTVPLRVERNDTPWTCRCEPGQILHIPIAHGDGNWEHHQEDYLLVEEHRQILLRYEGGNPNGSMGDAAGLMNRAGNVFGLMPHPERATDDALGSADGRLLIESIIEWIRIHHSEQPHD